MRTVRWIILSLLLLGAQAARAIAPGQQIQVVSGSNTTAGITCTMTGAQVASYTVLLDGSSLATSTITVAVQVLDVNNNTYVTPAGVGNPNVADPATLGTAVTFVQIPGPVAGIQVNVTSFGTATGTFRAVIVAN